MAVAEQMPSWVLARLDRETCARHAIADSDRLALLVSRVTPERYRHWLARVYGFESPVESALQMTLALDGVIDLRARTSMTHLRADLVALGIANPSLVPRSRHVFPFRSAAEALGWIYVVERNAQLHGELRRHLAQRLPDELARAGAYVGANERVTGSRMRELGDALDQLAVSADVVDQVAAAAHDAFRHQQRWFAEGVSTRVRVA